MNVSQLRLWLAAPMAGLFLLLGIAAFVVHRPQPAMGLSIPLQKIRSHSPNYVCEDDRLVIVRITGDGRLWINETGMTPTKLATTLKLIYENRPERVVYLMADPSVPYQQYIDTLNIVRSSIDGLHVVLLTKKLQRYYMALPVPVTAQALKELDHCPLEWTENGFVAPSIYSSDDMNPLVR